MTLLVIIFGLVFLLTFGVVAFAMAPSRDDKIFQHRIDAVTNQGAAGEASAEAIQLLRQKTPSHFAFIEQLLADYKPMQRFRHYVSQAGVNADAASILVQAFVLAVVGYFVAMYFTRFPPVDVVVALMVGSVPIARIVFLRWRRIRLFEDSLAQGIDMMARALRAGHSVSSAFEIVAQGAPMPASAEFGEVFRQQNFGMPIRDALLLMLDRVPSQDLRVLVTGIIVQRETGGNLVEILERTVFVIRERQRIRGEVRTQTAQGRLTGWILTFLPVIMLVLLNIVDPGYSRLLLDDPTGRKLCYAGIVMIVIGAYFINKIINSIEV